MILKQEFKKDFVIVSRLLMQDKSLSYKAKALACFLSSLPSEWIIYTKWIAGELGMCVREVQRSLKDLVDAGYIKKMQIIDAKTNKFTSGWSVIFLNKEQEKAGQDESENDSLSEDFKEYEQKLENAQKIETLELDEAINSDLGQDEGEKTPENSPFKEATKMGLAVLSRTYIRKDFLCNKKDFLIKKSDKNFLLYEKKQKEKEVLDFNGFSEKEREKILEWFSYKARQKRKKLSPMSKQYQLKKIKLFKLAKQDIIKIINKSIEMNWQGLFPIKQFNRKKSEQSSVKAEEKEQLLAYFHTIRKQDLCEV